MRKTLDNLSLHGTSVLPTRDFRSQGYYMMQIIIFVLLSLFPITALAESPVITEQAQLGNERDTIKVEAYIVSPLNNSSDPAKYDDAIYKIKIFLNGQSAPLQEIDTFAQIDEPWIELVDLNGDGYIDILFYNMHAGWGSGPTIGADVYIYVPKLKKYVMSKTLTSRGRISKAKTTNCVNVLYKSSMMGYTTETWCFLKSKGLWKMDSSETTKVEK